MSLAFVVLAVGTGVVVIAIATEVVLVVRLVTLSMRDRESATQRSAARSAVT